MEKHCRQLTGQRIPLLNAVSWEKIGEMRMLVKQVRKGRVTIEEAAEDAGMTVEEFKKILENTPLQAV